jgi:hypothetical protein
LQRVLAGMPGFAAAGLRRECSLAGRAARGHRRGASGSRRRRSNARRVTRRANAPPGSDDSPLPGLAETGCRALGGARRERLWPQYVVGLDLPAGAGRFSVVAVSVPVALRRRTA